MKRLLILLLFGLIIVAFGLKLIQSTSPQTIPEQTPMDPEAQVARLTSVLLVRKVSELRNKTVYLQHREEGRMLLELALEEEESE